MSHSRFLEQHSSTTSVKIVAGAIAGSVITTCLFAAAGPRAEAQSTRFTATAHEYRLLDPDWLSFNSAVLAQDYMNNLGAQGWIFPPGTLIARHTFHPGTASQQTRFIIRPSDQLSDEFVDVIIRRETAR